jgi:DNA-binding response OmpR family regulator
MTTSSSPKLALIVDDDDHIREVLQTLLETSGFQVDTVSDGIDVVELKKEYHVILLDMKMPIFDAGRLTDYWRLTDPAILNRVILLSGYSRLASNRDFGTYASIAKPFDCEELLETIEACARQAESNL